MRPASKGVGFFRYYFFELVYTCMIILVSGVNFIVVTIAELTSIENPEYLMILKNASTGKFYAFKLGDDLRVEERANKFLVTVKDDADPLLSEVSITDAGQYDYFIFETADADTFDFDNISMPETGLVEQGRLEYQVPVIDKKYYANTKTQLNTYV
jgi:hypothetical protein